VFRNLHYKVLALVAAFGLWGVAHSTSSLERGFDIPVIPANVPEELVITGQSTDAVNIRVRGNNAALRRLSVAELEYPVDLAGARPGTAERDVELAVMNLPRGAQVVSRSPASLEFTLERKSTRAVKVRPDLDGQPAPGFVVGEVVVDPPRVRIAGARSEVLRLSEVLTETIELTGANAPLERRVRTLPGGLHVWLDGAEEVTVRVEIGPEPPPEPEPEPKDAKKKTKKKAKEKT
jgi:YbbR domain-containing protein